MIECFLLSTFLRTSFCFPASGLSLATSVVPCSMFVHIILQSMMAGLGSTSLSQAACSVTTAATAPLTRDVVIPTAPER